MKLAREGLLACALLAGGCGGGEESPDPDAQAGSGGNAQAGSAGQGGTSAGGSGGGSSGKASCAESFGLPEPVLAAAAGRELASPSVGPGELELFYVEYEAGGLSGHFMRST